MRSRLLLVLLALFVAAPRSSFAQSAARADGGAVEAVATPSQRLELANRLLDKWRSHVREAYRLEPDQWASSLASTLATATVDQLQRALNAPTFAAMNDELLRGEAGRRAVIDGVVQAGSSTAGGRIGELANDLVFVPITPCRIFDTRLAGGPIAARSTRHFDVNSVGDFSYQGGEVGDCGVGDAGSFAAALVNLTVVAPSAAGYLAAFPYQAPQPLTATVVYAAGAIVGNLAAVKLDQGPDPFEMSVFSFAETHVVADLVGYFTTPQATPLECLQVASTLNDIAGGASGSAQSAACPSGYSLTGGGCIASSFDTRVVTSRPFATTFFCAFNNGGTVTTQVSAVGQCCRVPGR